jgi:hypothetical protein
MLLLTITSCTTHTNYKVKNDVIAPPAPLLEECKAVDVKDGATNKDQLLHFLSEAYIDTLKNMSSCNIKIRAAKDYIRKVENEAKSN